MARRGKISQCDYRNPLLKVPLRLIDKKRKKFIKIPYRTPDYFWFDPYSLELEGYTLIRGKYQPIQPNQQGWLWSEELGLYLGFAE
jgi:Uma2 family endonuclease